VLVRIWRKGNPVYYCRKYKLVQPVWKTVWRVLKKLKIELPYDPHPTSVYVPDEMRSMHQRDIYNTTCTAALFTIAKGKKHARAHQLMNR
jgi:hypothetical protein